MKCGSHSSGGFSIRNDTAIFTLKMAVVCVFLNYYLGGLPVLMFVAGWWWGGRDVPRDEEGISWE